MKLADAVITTQQILHMDPEQILGRVLDKETLTNLGFENVNEVHACEVQAWRITFDYGSIFRFSSRHAFDTFQRTIFCTLLAGIRYARSPFEYTREWVEEERLDLEQERGESLESIVERNHAHFDALDKQELHAKSLSGPTRQNSPWSTD